MKEIPESTVLEVLALFERGLYLQAYAHAQKAGALTAWNGTNAMIAAARLMHQLGAPRLATGRALRVWRSNRAHPEARLVAGNTISSNRGPWAALSFLRAQPASPQTPALLAFEARLHAQFRDFGQASALIARARALAPADPWILVEAAYCHRLADRYEDALALLQDALARAPLYRPAVQAAAHVLAIVGRAGEALDLLAKVAPQLEAASLWLQRAELLHTARRPEEAEACYQQFEALSPLLEPRIKTELTTRRQAAKEAECARTELAVAFVRQHHRTCAPACLAMIAGFWGVTAEQSTIALDVCYDGTEDYDERRWAEEQGWAVREMTLTWDAARALIDRGIPFLLNTQDSATGHVQIVNGYDAAGRLLIRDPYDRNIRAFPAVALLERHLGCGPRCMVMVPQDRAAALLGDLALPEAALHDQRFQFRKSLAEHARDLALATLAQLEASAGPDHWLVRTSALELARYDQDATRTVAATTALHRKNPRNKRYLYLHLEALAGTGRNTDRLALLEDATRGDNTDPVFMGQLADELRRDPSQRRDAIKLLNRAIAGRPSEAMSYRYLGELCPHDAPVLFRIASSLDDKNEALAEAYARVADRDAAALAYLRDRVARFGTLSSAPARTLHAVLRDAGLPEEAAAVMRAALAQHPEDLGAHHQCALAIQDDHGRSAALEHIRGFARAAAHVPGVKRLVAGWLRDDDSMELGAALADLIAAEPLDGWARREIAMFHAAKGRKLEARKELANARARSPERSGATEYALGYIARLEGSSLEAREAFVSAAHANPDMSLALAQALACADGHTDRILILRGYAQVLKQRGCRGEGFLTFLAYSTGVLDEEEIGTTLGTLWHAHPGRPEIWSAMTRHLARNGDLANAEGVAAEGTKRFPSVATLAIDLAEVRAARGDSAGEITALRSAVAKDPSSLFAARKLAAALAFAGRPAEEIAVLRAALRYQPRDQLTLGALAESLYRAGEPVEAKATLTLALRRGGAFEWGWRTLHSWADARPLAEEVARARPDDGAMQWMLARVLPEEDLEQRLKVLERAVALDGSLVSAHEDLVTVLHQMGRAAEADAMIESGRLPWDLANKLALNAARLYLETNDPAGALAALAALLQRSPRSFEGWTLKADAHQARRDDADYLAAAREMVRLDPLRGISHAYLGEARQRNGDIPGAKSAFAACLECIPGYDFAAYSLLDLQIEGQEWDDAAATIAHIRDHCRETGEPLTQRERELAVKRTTAIA